MEPLKTITVFTPTYNRAHTLPRTYESLTRQTCKDFVWLIIDDGSEDNTRSVVELWIDASSKQVVEGGFEGYSADASWLHIRYCYKENGGLHTGYNKAIELMDTELCVCIDSDDFMPDDAVDTILCFWDKHRSPDIAGFFGLDCFCDGTPIGGEIIEVSEPIHYSELKYGIKHHGDIKMVIRVDLFKAVAPMPSFPGEKNFNPIYMILLIDQKLPFLTINKNLCYVDYQEGGMSSNIFYQYINSPKSFCKLRLVEMRQPKLPYRRFLMENLHYVSDKFLAGEPFSMLNEGASKIWVILLYIPGLILSRYIHYMAKING